MHMPISDLTDQQLDNLESNYRTAKKTDGGIYSLAEVLLEKKRRRPTPFRVREVAVKIIELARGSKDGLVTYGEIWNTFSPNTPWQGHKNLRIVADSLARVIEYCVTNKLPILTVLVVQTGNRKLSAQAIKNIYQECKELGVDVGLDPKEFVDSQIRLSREVVIDQLPYEGPPEIRPVKGH
jgi:hypothetical protein